MFARLYVKKYQKNQGFSLVELMTVIAVLVILVVGAGYASYRMGLLHGKTSIQQIKVAYEHGRLQAMQDNEAVVICPQNLSEVEPTCLTSTGGVWDTRKLLIFKSHDRKPPYDADKDQIITQVSLPKQAQSIRWRGFPSPNYIVIQAGGISSSNGALRYCDGGKAINGIMINTMARVRYLSVVELETGC